MATSLTSRAGGNCRLPVFRSVVIFNDYVRGLIDEYRLYFRPFVLGGGKPYFAGARPPLRLIAADPVGEDAVRLTYVPT
jgi:hypothetical protein